MQPLTRSRPRPRFFGTSGPSFALDFVNGTNALDPRVTFTRASSATYFDSAGVLQSAANDVPRFDYNPATLAAQGLLIEESRTNTIRNNTMQGAVAGAPGTLPTNWAVFAASGMTTTVVGTGVQSGVTYIDLRISGTSTATFYVMAFDVAATPASAGQSWTESFWAARIAGSLANINAVNFNIRFDSGPVFDSPFVLTETFARQSATTTTPGGATNVIPAVFLNIANSAAIDITIRIGLPQLEQGAFATSVIPTTTTALTRANDLVSVNTLTPWYSESEGTLYVEADAGVGDEPTYGAFQNANLSSIMRTTRAFGFARYVVVDGSTGGFVDTFGPTIPAGSIVKIAQAHKAGDYAMVANGAAPALGNLASVPTVNQLTFGLGGFGTWLNGHVRRVAFFKRRLADSELQALTL